jgi:hypothetical protein
MNVLVMNPGGNSLKVELISCSPGQQAAFEGSKLLSLTVEGIGKKPCLSVLRGKEVTHREEIEAKDYGAALEALVVVTEEGLQIAHECSQALGGVSRSLHQSLATL